jgi:hypothetical protein
VELGPGSASIEHRPAGGARRPEPGGYLVVTS